jgi:predicted metalloprotease with PDZ domain
VRRVTLALFALLFPSLLFSQAPSLEYKLGMSKPWTHFFEVEMSVRGVLSQTRTLDFLMPVWRTGRYVIYDFAGGVQDFSAVDQSGHPLPWAKTDKSTWHVEKGLATAVTIRYKVYANEFDQRTRGLDDEHAFVDGCAVFMYVERYRHLPLALAVTPYQDWHVTTGLEALPNEKRVFSAPNFDYLVDSPLEIGHQKDFEFEVEGKEHVLSIFGEANYNSDTLIKDISTIVRANKELWGDLPYKRYVFLLELSPQGRGATEHINSTIMQTSPGAFKNPTTYRSFLGLVSHEYFHTWNVKQLRPKGLLPYNYQHENYTKELWVAEGMTSYYGGLMLVRCGLAPASSEVDGIARAVQSDRLRPGNKIQSLDESSFDAWIKASKGLQQSYNSESDFYGKGSNVSLLLDLEIRERSANKHSLDDVMRALYQRFPLSGTGYTVDDLQKTAEKFAGGSLKTFFDNYVHGTTPLDWEAVLHSAGLELLARDSERRPWLGVFTSDQNGAARVTMLVAGSPGYDAGLDFGDEILALNGSRVRSSDLQDRIADMKAGDTVKVTVFREDKLRDFNVTLRLQEVPPYMLVQTGHPTPLQKAIYESWLKTKWEEK